MDDKLNCKINISFYYKNDILITLEEISKKIEQGFLCGSDSSECTKYSYTIQTNSNIIE